MALPLIPIVLSLLGAGAADQALNEGQGARALGGMFAGAAGDVAGGATDFAIEPFIKMIIRNETLAESISEALTSGEYDRAFDLFKDNFDQVNFQGFAGLIGGGMMANSIANSIGLSGMRKLAVIAPVAMLAGTASTRLWEALQDGELELNGQSIWNAITQGQEEGARAAAEYTNQQTHAPQPPQRELVEPQ